MTNYSDKQINAYLRTDIIDAEGIPASISEQNNTKILSFVLVGEIFDNLI